MKQLLLTVFTLVSSAALAAQPKHLGTRGQQQMAFEWNRTHAVPMIATGWDVKKPFSEVEKTGYVAISSADNFELPQLREAIAKNLPADATLIVFIGDTSEASALKSQYGKYLGDRLKFLVVPQDYNSDTIWARDSLPFPVYMQTGMGLVDSLYPQSFEPDKAFGQAFSMPLQSTHQYFRGGNLLFDLDSNCFSENVNETAGLDDPDSYLKQNFGCKSVTLLNHRGGIGDIDERIKFLTGKDVLTDDPVYASLLKGKGYTIHMIPSTGADDETYMNTLLVNGTIFVPQMGISSDQSALDAYQALGFKPVGVYTKTMATEGSGNIHCVTMNYPPGAFVASPLGADFIQFASALH
ncbi:MAG: agmatine deiminase family protein [Bdellovibrionales bacterium]